MLAYDLPRELIAREPVAPRDAARLLLLKRALSGDSPRSGTVPSADLAHHTFRDLPGLLRAGDLLVFNDTRVVPARLRGRKAGTGGQVELLLLEGSAGRYRCLGKPGRRLRPGTRLLFNHGSLEAEVLSSDGEEKVIRFLGEEVSEQLARLGEMPLPPYIDRPVAPEDADWYQTVFARSPGAVAAPTAGLHFTGELLERLRAAGIRVAFLTLHVGWGTFKPVGKEELAAGRLHAERYTIPPATLQAITQAKTLNRRVIAVGTTVIRALESWALLRAVEASRALGESSAGIEGRTQLFIRPGFKFRVADGLITNFHLPGTSLLLLVSAFAGEDRITRAYREAIARRYRFYSYGDGMLIL